MPNGLVNGGVEYVVAAFVITWVVLGATLARVLGAVRRARAEYESASKGEFRT
jgi:hypothetical protein